MKSQLFVKKFMDIDAPTEKVWDVLVKREFSDQWSQIFSEETKGFHVESEWNIGSSVDWLGNDGKVVVTGEVVTFEPYHVLQYTTVDVGMAPIPDADENDGIRFELEKTDGKTKLVLIHGDFNKMEDGRKYYDMTVKSWDEILPKIKELAEAK